MSKFQSGFRDFLYTDAAIRMRCIHSISQVYQAHGFTPLETPALEDLSLLLGKGGNENEKMIFKILKRGHQFAQVAEKMISYDLLTSSDVSSFENQLTDYGLRFDLTLPLSRVLQSNQGEIRLPWKVFHIGPVWRAERAQKGRFREFIQCDVDILGVSEVTAEVEVIQAAVQALEGLGVQGFQLVLNDRRLVDAMASEWGFHKDQLGRFAILLDKKDKMSSEDLIQELEKLLEGSEEVEVERAPKHPRQKKLCQDFSRLILDSQMTLGEAKRFDEDAVSGLERIIELLTFLKLPLAEIKFDPSLVRGMGYYTGPIFELRHASAGYSFGGGGRYDGLVGGLPACGMSLGFERLFVLLQEMNTHPNQKIPFSSLFLPVLEEKGREQLFLLAQRFRGRGLGVDLYPGKAPLKSQLKFASHLGYRWVLFAGETEWRKGLLTLKDFHSGEEKELSEEQIVQLILNP